MYLLFPLLGIAAGVLAGLLGVGGGLVLVAALAWLLPLFGVPQEAAMHAALASSLASIVLTAASSARSHARRGGVLWPTVAWMVPGLLLGGWLGSGLAVALDDAVLRWVVCGYCLLAAWQIGFGGTRPVAGGGEAPAPRGWPMSLAGGGIGALSAVVGIGGGSMTVPLLVWRGVRPVRAVGTSSACGVAIGLASALGYALHAPPGALPQHAVGYVYLPAAIGVAAASVLAAPWGTRLAHRLSGQALRSVFALFLLAVAVSVPVSG
ncbi:phosphotransferase system, fructose-specific IIC component [Pseudoxanthomonas broegbernensis]|uniref:Probable membrane transporter protein n=1 Tax=Pseudoxanthomonas broegbernensis TaxID=83619 RepID=A0A7V8K6H8_9GAMM|nr:sulfite exporter TauE/SafE family protein [Pseudoxanthomonas broegbernensis]KAF1685174.1 phosphotransferase system, fructose-specific IIC component [Pseudoxanthomonas broegbernensis]MBB6065302.1 putative membrane protein YfcA [Pseudoxanthomonas broegbernensis]